MHCIYKEINATVNTGGHLTKIKSAILPKWQKGKALGENKTANDPNFWEGSREVRVSSATGSPLDLNKCFVLVLFLFVCLFCILLKISYEFVVHFCQQIFIIVGLYFSYYNT